MATETVLRAIRHPGATTIDVRRATACLEQIATLADALDRECYLGPLGGDVDRAAPEVPEHVRLLVHRLQDAVCQLGWMADRGAGLLGGTAVRGGADVWLLPATFNASGDCA